MRRKRSRAALCMQSRANELPSLREVEEERAVGAGWECVKTFFFFFFRLKIESHADKNISVLVKMLTRGYLWLSFRSVTLCVCAGG